MTIMRIETMTYGVTDLPVCIEFLKNWGLENVAGDDAGAMFRTAENQSVILRRSDDESLPPTHEEVPTLREVIWGVDTQDALDQIRVELSTDRDVSVDAGGTLHTRDDCGNYIGFKIAKVTPVDGGQPPLNFHENIKRLNARGWPEDRVTPLRIGHLVYSIESEGNWEAAEFYINRLGFRLTDRSKDGGSFLRCEGSSFHHSLFLFHRVGTEKYFNHVAFEVNSFDEIMMGGSHMKKQGAVSVSGPGRHSLGSNWFWYFKNPCGGDIEYFADMDRMDDNWEPRVWDKAPPYARWMIGDDVLTG
jgi:Glyoxalase/Bleomycin resistance protein/Dioxygenase superfamily